MTSQSISTQRDIPDWLIWIQCLAFIVLYAFWILPEIVGVRNTSMIIGALASLYPIYVYRNKLTQPQAFPLWMIAALFVWAVAHYFFFSQDPEAQYRELHRIWRYAAISAVFGIGLGLSFCAKSKPIFWRLIYLGLCTPQIIYLIKYLATTYGAAWGFDVPLYLQINSAGKPYYIPKVDYTIFCMPALATAFGLMAHRFKQAQNFACKDIIFFLLNTSIIFLTFFLFYVQNIKNAMAYALLIFIIFILSLLKIIPSRKGIKIPLLFLISILSTIICLFSYQHLQKNESWKTLIADTKIAIQKEKYDHWKWAGEKGYPINEFGKVVSTTNYERVAWAIEATQLIRDNPNGYGLIELSFRGLMNKTYPEVVNVGRSLSHSHSGWLDIILGFGIIGGFLIITPLLYLIWSYRKADENFLILLLWSLTSLFLCWLTSEVSGTVPFMSMIFWIMFAGAFRLKRNHSEPFAQ
jgi:O-Antigen ligase